MFLITYKTTFKNLFRSPLFRMMFAVMGLAVFEVVISGCSGYYDFELNEVIRDTDPRFVLDFRAYVQRIANAVYSDLMAYAMPLFTSVSVVLILSRDYGDNFYEIEKAAGIKPTHYLLGRVAALLTINFAAAIIMTFIPLHAYVLSRGGVAGLDGWAYIIDSTVRLMRNLIFIAFPGILFYIAFTYCVGSVFKSGLGAAACSVGYVIFNYLAVRKLSIRFDLFFGAYLSPTPDKLCYYLHFYDTDLFETTLTTMDTSLGKAVLCIGILVGLGVLYSTIAYFRTRKRDR